MKKISILIAIFISVFLSRAQNYEATLKPLTPDVKPPSGFADFTLSGTNFTITSGSYQDLSGGATRIAYQVDEFLDGGKIGLIPAPTLDTPGATNGTFSGTVGLNSSQINALNDGQLFITIFGPVGHAPGELGFDEIRGKITIVPEPTSLALMGTGMFALVLLRRWKI